MLNEKDYGLDKETRASTFAENMESVLVSAGVKNIRDITLVFVAVFHEDHYYCVCFNLKDIKIEVLDNSAAEVAFHAKYRGWPEKLQDALATYLDNAGHPSGSDMKGVVPVRLEMPWHTKHNKIDCDVFVMRHMETYKGVNGRSWE